MTGTTGVVAAHEPRALLVGRQREQQTLREYFAAAQAGHGSVVLIGGEAGIGKTALAEDLGHAAANQGALVLTGRCYDRTETPPYGPWIELLDGYEAIREQLSFTLAANGSANASIVSQNLLFNGAQHVLAELAAQQPLVVFLDDLHWADAGSLDFLRFLARQLAPLPILLVITYRADELTREHPLYTLIPLLVREASAERLDLRRLTEDDVRMLVRTRYQLSRPDEDWTVNHLQSRAEGNPFFIGELLRTLEEEDRLRPTAEGWTLSERTRVGLPPLLRQVLSGRLARLGEHAERALAIAAVLGSEVPIRFWASVAGLAEDNLLDIIEVAVRARLLTESRDGQRIAFAHALIRETLYEDLPPSRRVRWHRLAAEALVQVPAPDPDIVAYHFSQASDPRAAEWLVRAGERAHRVYAHLTAATRFEAALALMRANGNDLREQGWILYRLARLRRYLTPTEGLSWLAEAAQLAGETGDRALAAHVRYYRGFLLCITNRLRQGLIDLAEGVEALAALAEADRAQLAARGLPLDINAYRGMVCSWLAEVGRFQEAVLLGEAIAAEPPAGVVGWDSASYGDLYFGLGHAYAALGRPNDAEIAFERARNTFEAVGNHALVGQSVLSQFKEVCRPYQTDRVTTRRRIAELGEEAWRQTRDVFATFAPSLVRLPLFLIEGEWHAIDELAQSALGPTSFAGARRSFLPILGYLAWYRGTYERAWEIVREGLPDGLATEPGDMNFQRAILLQRLAAYLALDAGDLATARDWLMRHDRWLAWSGAIAGRADGEACWAAYYLARRDLTQARRRGAHALVLAGEPRQPLALLAAHRLLGSILHAAGQEEEARTHLASALMLADTCAAPYEWALTYLALAELNSDAQDRSAATAALDEVRAICAPLGAAPALARAEKVATGLARRPVEAASGYPAGLSAREVEVLRLLTTGLTNRQIAAHLSLSTPTIKNHVAHILAKTGTDNRAAAAAFALRHNLA
jgi:DNA-binding CsgD family transcriptional regulator/tetratricopeptide (TPR) repeat protein